MDNRKYYKLENGKGESRAYYQEFKPCSDAQIINKKEYDEIKKQETEREIIRKSKRTEYETWHEDEYENHSLGDGVYDVSGIKEILEIRDELSRYEKWKHWDKVKEFIKKYPDYTIGAAYQCYQIFFLSNKPEKFKGKVTGSGFNHGSCNLLTECPAKLLILGEDD